MARTVAVVSHTHWDREWYAPQEAFQARLVEVVDGLLELLESDPSYRHFLLDGQMAMVEDYLAVRPEAGGRLRSLAGAGRLAVGPWYVLMDEFGVSGETIVRNLQLGLRRAAVFAPPMEVGYLPDMFGHVAQMPQLLRLAGIGRAVVWRGVPSAVDRTAFRWRAPDGSSVQAEYLPAGYSNGAYLPRDAGALVRRIEAHEAQLAGFLGPETPLLLMNGTDHQAPQPWLAGLLAEANDRQDRFDFRHVSLLEYLAAAPAGGLPEWSGEMRSGARTNLLMGVASNRVDVKVAAATAERLLEKVAEPLAALWLPPGDWPGDVLERAWLQVIRNAAHDSICACSADPVVRAVVHRYDAAVALAGEAIRRTLDIASLATRAAGPVLVNPGPRRAATVFETVLAGTDPPPGTQALSATPEGVEERPGIGDELGAILAGLTADGWLPGGSASGTTAALRVTPAALEVEIEVDPTRVASPDVASVMAEAYTQAGARPSAALRVTVTRRASQRVVAWAEVPGYGWAAWQPGPTGVGALRAGDGWLDNGVARVEVDPADGTFSLGGVAGLDRLVDSGDEGDTYTYSPPASDVVVDRPRSVHVEVAEQGPLRGRLRVRRRYVWPARVSGGARVGEEPVEVVTDLELRAGEPLVRVQTSFDNRCRDHRVRSVMPLPAAAAWSEAECAYATVRRSAGPAEGGPHERGVPTYPSRRFVSAGGLTVTHEGLLEYELVDDGRALALTLLRATGMLSRPTPAYRPNAAGPAVPVEGPQLLGSHRVRYAVAVGVEDPWALADQAWLLLPVVRGTGTGRLPETGSRLRVDGAEVAALHRVEGSALELRVFNPTPRPAAVRVAGHSGWLVDLRGGRGERWDGGFELRPWGIATARLDVVDLDRVEAPGG